MPEAPKHPARALPLLYLGTAHVSLALAFLFAGCWPQAVAGFFYHAWLIGLVHLVTLGWISLSILGAMYIVGPLALRMDMPARRLDYVAYACALVGLIGMVGHFWIEQYSGMAWSAATIAIGILYMTVRIIASMRCAKIQRSVTLHIVLACVNFWLAASMGVLIAFDKVLHFLPGFVLANVFAHAHLAALGWATLMLVAVAYQMLPMTFPSTMPSGVSTYASALLLEIGVLGLFTTLLMRSTFALVFGIIIVIGLACFLSHVVWMRRRLVSKPVDAPRIDFGVLHAASAGASLIAAASIGLMLLIRPLSPTTLHAAAAYGVLGLVGFLSQAVVAMEARLLLPPLLHVTRDRTLQAMVFAGWTVGVPMLAAGMFVESARLVGAGAWALFIGVTLGMLDSACVVSGGMQTRPISYEAAWPAHR